MSLSKIFAPWTAAVALAFLLGAGGDDKVFWDALAKVTPDHGVEGWGCLAVSSYEHECSNGTRVARCQTTGNQGCDGYSATCMLLPPYFQQRAEQAP